MILECHRTFTGMPPFIVAMEERCNSLCRLCADDDDPVSQKNRTLFLTITSPNDSWGTTTSTITTTTTNRVQLLLVYLYQPIFCKSLLVRLGPSSVS